MTKKVQSDDVPRQRNWRLLESLVDIRAELRESCKRDDLWYRAHLRPYYLALEALNVAGQRGDEDGIREIERACRAVLDRAWQPMVLAPPAEAVQLLGREPGRPPWPRMRATVPLELRPAEAHRLLHHVVLDARRYVDRLLANKRRGSDAGATARLFETLHEHRAHFPTTKHFDATVGPIADALFKSALHERDPLGPVLRAWGCPDAVVKHAQRTVRRR